MAFTKKTWINRLTEYPSRRRLQKEDGTSELVTVSREEGTISAEGDAFSAENMNDLEERIAAEFTEINSNLYSDAIWGTHNKPSGVYAGNGSATSRTIDTGCTGNVILLYNNYGPGMAIVTPSGAICLGWSTVSGLTKSQCKFENGILTMATDSTVVNPAGHNQCYYQVL